MQLFVPKKKPKITPLTTKDIFVAELDCRDTVDRTEEYRLMISDKQHPLSISASSDSSTRSRTQTQMLRLLKLDALGVPHELQRQSTFQQRLTKQFESLEVNFDPTTDLRQMVKKIANRITFYQDKQTKSADALKKMYKHYHSITIEGRISVSKASSNSDILYQNIIRVRESYKAIRCNLVESGSKIRDLALRSKNLDEVVSIVNIWKDTLMGRIGYFSQQSIFHLNVTDILDTMDEVIRSFKSGSESYVGYGCFQKLQQFINKKKKEVVSKVEKSLELSVINFDEARYPQILKNYRLLVAQKKSKGGLNSLGLMVDNNLDFIINSILGKEYYREALQEMTNQQYMGFFQALAESLVRYCRNWHLVTRWHLQYTNEGDREDQTLTNNQGQQQLRFRKVIFQKIEQRICNILGKSYAFYNLSLNQRALLILIIYSLVRQMSLFARQTPKGIGETIRKKCKEERQVLDKSYCCWLKQLITTQLRAPIFQPFPETKPSSSGDLAVFTQEELSIVSQLQNNQLLLDFQSWQEYVVNTKPREIVKLDLFPVATSETNSSSLLVRCYAGQICKRIHFNLNVRLEMFKSLSEMVEMQVVSLYLSCCPANMKAQLQENWSGFNLLKFSKYDDVEANMPKLQYYQECSVLQTQYVHLCRQIPKLLKKFGVNQSTSVVPPSIETKANLLQNLNDSLVWIKQNTQAIFLGNQDDEIQLINQQIGVLGLLVKELTDLVQQSALESTRSKYESLFSSIKELKWEIKKYNNETSELFKGYKNNYFGILQSQVLPVRALKIPTQMKRAIQDSLVDQFFKSLTQAYSKVEKINSNGRQLMRLDTLQLQQRIKTLGISSDASYLNQLAKFIQMGYQGEANKLESLIRQNIQLYPFRIWKCLLVSCKASEDINWVQRREILLRLAQHYLSVISQKR